MSGAASVFGRGLAFPPRVGPDGRLAFSAGEENVRESIRIILLTEPGERLMREGFGCGLHRFLAEPNTPATRAQIRERVQEALRRWEPRITVETVEAEASPDEPRLVLVTIAFRLIATGLRERLGLALELER
jgi:phage baseplate assembly protein W